MIYEDGEPLHTTEKLEATENVGGNSTRLHHMFT